MTDERDLATLADVRSWLNIAATDGSHDDDLSSMITACSMAMQKYMQRDIVQLDYAHLFNGTGGSVLVLRAAPVTLVKSVTVDGLPIDPAKYTNDDKALYLLGGHRFPRGPLNVAVRYTAGYDAVPPDLARACVETVGLRWRERDRIGHSSKSLQGETVSFTITDFPVQVKTLMNSYMRVTP